jgi:phospholipid transport system substrate-binding protein
MMTWRRAALGAFIALAFGLATPLSAQANAPETVILETSSAILAAVGDRREELAADETALFEVVDDILLPRFDRDYSGRLVMGKTYRDATPEQRERFITGLYRKLVRTYSSSILDYDSESLQILGTKGDIADGKVIVETEVRLDDGTPVPVGYRMRETDGTWKAYDVIIEGISYVANYRKQYDGEFRAKGIDGVIRELEAEGPASE